MHVSSGSSKGRRRSLNFELNLVPFIDVLSTCICFLLVTAVFINLGAFHVNQAIGTEKSSESKKKTGNVTVSLGSGGEIRFVVADVAGLSREESQVTIAGENGQLNHRRTAEWIDGFARRHPAVKTVMLLPNPKTKYDDVIQLMSQFRKSSMDQIGVAPL